MGQFWSSFNKPLCYILLYVIDSFPVSSILSHDEKKKMIFIKIVIEITIKKIKIKANLLLNNEEKSKKNSTCHKVGHESSFNCFICSSGFAVKHNFVILSTKRSKSIFLISLTDKERLLLARQTMLFIRLRASSRWHCTTGASPWGFEAATECKRGRLVWERPVGVLAR